MLRQFLACLAAFATLAVTSTDHALAEWQIQFHHRQHGWQKPEGLFPDQAQAEGWASHVLSAPGGTYDEFRILSPKTVLPPYDFNSPNNLPNRSKHFFDLLNPSDAVKEWSNEAANAFERAQRARTMLSKGISGASEEKFKEVNRLIEEYNRMAANPPAGHGRLPHLAPLSPPRASAPAAPRHSVSRTAPRRSSSGTYYAPRSTAAVPRLSSRAAPNTSSAYDYTQPTYSTRPATSNTPAPAYRLGFDDNAPKGGYAPISRPKGVVMRSGIDSGTYGRDDVPASLAQRLRGGS